MDSKQRMGLQMSGKCRDGIEWVLTVSVRNDGEMPWGLISRQMCLYSKYNRDIHKKHLMVAIYKRI